MGIKVTQCFANITAKNYINDFPSTSLVSQHQGGQVTFGGALAS